MAGSTIFAVYTDGNGGVTVSPRDGAGHFQPQHSASKNVTILAGSKADANTVVANFRYRATESQLDVQSSASPFIGAWKEGAAFDTMNLEQALEHHDDKRIYTLNLAEANVGISTNPFLDASTVQAPGQGSQGGSDVSLGTRLLKAHGILMGVAWLIVFPAGAVLMRLRWGGVWAHVFVQVLGTSMVIAAFGVGYSFAGKYGLVSLFSHATAGSWWYMHILTTLAALQQHPHYIWRFDLRPHPCAALPWDYTPLSLQA